MNKNSISLNAARLWQLMNDGTVWSYTRIRESSLMTDQEIATSIGWLSREDTLEIIIDPKSGKDLFRVRQFWETACS